MLTTQDKQQENNHPPPQHPINPTNNNNNSILMTLSHSQKESLLNIIYQSDIRQIRLLPTNTYNLNFHFPFKNTNIHFDHQITPLILSCFIGKLDIFIQIINNDFINVNLPSEPNKYSPLMIACFKGYYEIARMLLEKNADVNQKNKDGQVPFLFIFSRLEQNSYHYENKKICMMLIELLLTYGADINTKFDNVNGYTVLMKLVDGEILNETKLETVLQMLRFLIERGADVCVKGNNGKNVIDVIKDNNNILSKYKEELIEVINNTKQMYFFNDDISNDGYNKEGLKHFRLFSKMSNDIIFERNEVDERCCVIF